MKKMLQSVALAMKVVVPLVVAMPVLGLSSASAQTKPLIAYMLPAGGQRGTTVKVDVYGRYLMGATEAHVSGGGATAKVVSTEQPGKDKKIPQRLDAAKYSDLAHVEVTLAPDAKPGERDLRVMTAGGVSNRLRFYVGQVSEINEVEPNSIKEEAQSVEAIPVVVNGQIFQADSDIFRIKVKGGQTLVFNVDAQRIVPYIADGVPGWFQSVLTLYDAQGRELTCVDDFRHHPDPILVYKVEKDGEYLVEIKDALYRGRDDFVYRLTIGAVPLVTHVFPLGWQRNSETPVRLFGANLPTDKMVLKLPPGCPPRESVEVSAGGLTSNAISFAVDDLPEKIETEPNDTPEQASRIVLPANVNGRIQQAGDNDYFIFAATKGQKIVVDVRARRLDSPMDSIITLYNATGGQLAENDDTQDLSEGLITHHADSYLAYTIPADGDYVLKIADVEGLGGEEYAYRFSLAPPRPDFQLRIQPDSPRTAQGSTAMFTVSAFRQDGFSGEIRLSIKGLPDGFIAPDDVIPEKQGQVRMTISAPLTAPIGIFSPRVVGTAADERAKAEYDAADNAAKEAEKAAAAAKAAADKAAAAQANAEKAAAAKRQQADEAKKKMDDLAQNQQKTAETNLAAAKAVTDAANAKAALDKALADAKAAVPNAQKAYDAAEKAAKDAESAAKTISADAGKPAEEKKKAADEAAAKRRTADEAKAALAQVQQKQQKAQTQADAAAKNSAQAETQRKSAEQTLANVKKQAAAATAAHPPLEKAAKAAEAVAATATAEADKARAALAAAEKIVPEKRKLVEDVRPKLAQTVVREALPAEDLMQAFYYMHNVPCQEFLLAVLERGPFALVLDLPPKEVLKVPARGRVELVVKANFKEGVQPGEIALKPDRIPKEWQIEIPPIAAGQNQTTVKITTFGNMFVHQGQTGSLVINATMKMGNQTIYGFVPSIPYEVGPAQ